MVKTKSDEIKDQIKKQDEEVYGDESISGSNPDPEAIQEETTRELVEDYTGNKPRQRKSFNIGDEVNKDEKALREE